MYPSIDDIGAKSPSVVYDYEQIDIREAIENDPEWPKAEEQAKGEMFDLFTPPEIFIDENGNFVFRPPYAITPVGHFGVRLIEMNLEPYRIQLEGYVEEDRYDQNKTTILLHSVKDGKTLRLGPNSSIKNYGFEILNWEIEKNFNHNNNAELIAKLKIKDNLTNRIINLRHDEIYMKIRLN